MKSNDSVEKKIVDTCNQNNLKKQMSQKDYIVIADGVVRTALILTPLFLEKKGDLQSAGGLFLGMFAFAFIAFSSLFTAMSSGKYDFESERKTATSLYIFATLVTLGYAIYLTVNKSKQDKKAIEEKKEKNKTSTAMVAIAWVVLVLTVLNFKLIHKMKL